MTDEGSRAAMRHLVRARRRTLTAAEISIASTRALRNLETLNLPRPASRVALFLPFDGELDTMAVARRAMNRRCRLYLPVITDLRRRRMVFVEWRPGARLVQHDTGIAQPPAHGPRLSPRQLDLVLVPLVAFDERCNRIGTGGGFYDRQFAFRLRRSVWRHPLLVGWAHDFQRVDTIAGAAWDVPLDYVVTDHGVYSR